ncbi:hypothetical protein H1P_6340018 [Hyella patelloides LEGE 07179]|uniref:Uncharacterized protein n=1 Tax=Hyella patelloides LEGE 07179 TaxID=945734 RepID=A0A563W1V8_9CYAN|nr:hypothetical protein H1P_6340018 [Hyella patelloides LEGE 07179]
MTLLVKGSERSLLKRVSGEGFGLGIERSIMLRVESRHQDLSVLYLCPFGLLK